MERFKHNKYLKFTASLILFLLVFWLTQEFINSNKPSAVAIRKVDSIRIMKDSTVVSVVSQKDIDKLLEGLKYKFIIPAIGIDKFSTEYYVLVFYKNSKMVGAFAYNMDKRLLHPGGTPLSSDLYDALDSFIRDNYK